MNKQFIEPTEYDDFFLRSTKKKYYFSKSICESKNENQGEYSECRKVLWDVQLCELEDSEEQLSRKKKFSYWKACTWETAMKIIILEKNEIPRSIHIRHPEFRVIEMYNDNSIDWKQMAEDEASENEKDFPLDDDDGDDDNENENGKETIKEEKKNYLANKRENGVFETKKKQKIK